jgi:hypothetical protein
MWQLILAAALTGAGFWSVNSAAGTDDFGKGALAWLCWHIAAPFAAWGLASLFL